MRRSHFFIPMKRELKSQACISAHYMERVGMVHMVGSGMYTHLPLGFKVFANLKRVLNKHLAKAGCAEHQFPAIQPVAMWDQSGRLEMFGNSIFTFEDQHGKPICLAPTHEVAAAYTAKVFIRSYRDLPVRISQVQTKFRDEARPRAGVVRTREFTMHDLYSFDTDVSAATEGYELIKQAYVDTLVEVRIPFTIIAQKDMGPIGGVKSHEIHALAEAGDDEYVAPDGSKHRSLEIAHIFMLGDKYTAPIGATFQNRDGSMKPVFMCSFGLGIERTVAAFIERYQKAGDDLHWSWALAPFKVMVIGQASGREMEELYGKLNASGYEPLLEDRDVSLSQRFREGFMLGLPIYVVFGRGFAAMGKVEIRVPRLGLQLEVYPDEVLDWLPSLEDAVKGAELLAMSFDVLKLDDGTKTAYVRINDPRDLEQSYCPILSTPTDLLGNYGGRQRETKRLKAGPYWVTPVLVAGDTVGNRQTYHDIPYVTVQTVDGLDFRAVSEAYASHSRSTQASQVQVAS